MSKKTLEIEPKAFGIKCNGQAIIGVVDGSQAEKKGVKVGWRVTEIGGKKVKSTEDVTKALGAGRKSGKKYKATFISKDEGARSTKEATAEGHKVTTVVESNAAMAAAPAEPAEASPDDEIAKKKAGEEAEAAKKAAEEAQAATKAEEERQARMNGDVILKYEMYAEKFTIVEGRLEGDDFKGAQYVDEEYALSFVMPKCKIHLTKETPQVVAQAEGDEKWKLYVKEEPAGMFQELEKEHEYFVIVVEDNEQAMKDQERMRMVWAAMDSGAESSGSKGREKEGCSCLWGNPCVDAYVCEDWDNRFAVAKKNKERDAGASVASSSRNEQTKQLYKMAEGGGGLEGKDYDRLLQERDLKEAGYG
jgi:hypothetical protein